MAPLNAGPGHRDVTRNVAFAGDPAHDVARLADSFGWDVLSRAVHHATAARARCLRDVLLVEDYLAALRRGAVDTASTVLNLLHRQLGRGQTAPATPPTADRLADREPVP